MTEFSEINGLTIESITGLEKGSERVLLNFSNGQEIIMYHSADCCESVEVEDVCGDPADLIGTPLLLAEEVTSEDNPDDVDMAYQDSFTWTFYKLSTIKGSVTIRWYGESNGYYSESVCLRWSN